MSKSKRQRIIVRVVVALVLVVLVRATHIISRVRLGYPANRILQGATRVEPLRVISLTETLSTEPDHTARAFRPTDPMVDDCYIIARGKGRGRAFANRIADVLLDEGTYTIAEAGCETLPGIIFRIWKGAESLDVVLCFHCGEMYTVTHDASGKPGQGVYTLMAGHSRRAFVTLSKESFPNRSRRSSPLMAFLVPYTKRPDNTHP